MNFAETVQKLEDEVARLTKELFESRQFGADQAGLAAAYEKERDEARTQLEDATKAAVVNADRIADLKRYLATARAEALEHACEVVAIYDNRESEARFWTFHDLKADIRALAAHKPAGMIGTEAIGAFRAEPRAPVTEPKPPPTVTLSRATLERVATLVDLCRGSLVTPFLDEAATLLDAALAGGGGA